jgi:hypothetical protein
MKALADCETLNRLPGANKTSSERARRATSAASMASGSRHRRNNPEVGSIHKTELRAAQVSRRGGEIICRLVGERVELQGSCVFYLEGMVEI